MARKKTQKRIRKRESRELEREEVEVEGVGEIERERGKGERGEKTFRCRRETRLYGFCNRVFERIHEELWVSLTCVHTNNPLGDGGTLLFD